MWRRGPGLSVSTDAHAKRQVSAPEGIFIDTGREKARGRGKREHITLLSARKNTRFRGESADKVKGKIEEKKVLF